MDVTVARGAGGSHWNGGESCLLSVFDSEREQLLSCVGDGKRKVGISLEGRRRSGPTDRGEQRLALHYKP